MLASPRWTHVALPAADLEASIDWYERFTPLRLLDRRADEQGQSAWLSHEGASEHPFVLVLVMFYAEQGRPSRQLGPFAHLGIELPSRDDVDRIAQRARGEGCLAWEPQQLPPPVGYVCAATDPDGNVVEFSFDQGVYARAREVYGAPG